MVQAAFSGYCIRNEKHFSSSISESTLRSLLRTFATMNSIHSKKISVQPPSPNTATLEQAVVDGGGELSGHEEANALIWASPKAELLPQYLHDGLEWIQLPFAGIEPFLGLLDNKRQWTCGKGVYAPPVAEHVLSLILAGLHNLGPYSQAKSWQGPKGANLRSKRVLILGGGGISEELLTLLQPFDCHTVVLRRQQEAMLLANETLAISKLNEQLPQADVVVLALALTEETRGIIGAKQLALMKRNAWLINVARGAHIDTDELVTALNNNDIEGAALDVTEPEPLPANHPLWGMSNCLITPHVGNTPEMGRALLAAHTTKNTERYLAGTSLLGGVNPDEGY